MTKRVSLVSLASLAAALVAGCAAPTEPTESAKAEEAPLKSTIAIVQETDIHASVDVAWRDLVTVSCYSHWNPWLLSSVDQTHPEPGAELQVGDEVVSNVVLTGGAQSAPDKVTVVTPPGTPDQPAGQLAQLCWRDDIPLASSIAPAHRCRTFTANADGSVHLKNELVLEGALDWLVLLLEGSAMRTGMSGENAALAALAERGVMDPLTCEVP